MNPVDRYSFQHRQAFFIPENANEKNEAKDEDSSSGPREVPEVIGRLAAGERVEMSRENWDMGERANDIRDLIDGADSFLAEEGKK
jgi:hypothetical protein